MTTRYHCGSSECHGSKMYLAASINNEVNCDGPDSCKAGEFIVIPKDYQTVIINHNLKVTLMNVIFISTIMPCQI